MELRRGVGAANAFAPFPKVEALQQRSASECGALVFPPKAVDAS